MNKFRLGLSLSGGGYRAAAYHLGTLRKLHELNLLHEVDVLSTISGGSIIGAYYCLNKDNFKAFSDSLYEKVQTTDTIRGVLFSWTFLKLAIFLIAFIGPAICLLFTPYAWASLIVMAVFFILLLNFQFVIFPVSKRIEKIFEKFFYGKNTTLSALPEKPALVIGTTNLNTSRLFTFSKDWMQDSTYQYLDPPVKFRAAKFPLSRAVIASSCVPFAFTPIRIDEEFFLDKNDVSRVNPVLVDGGVYDNQGIHKVMQTGEYQCEYRIVSDAGNKVPTGNFGNTFTLLVQTVDVFMARIKNVQMVQGIYTENTIEKEIAYISLEWDIENCIPGFIRNLKKKQVSQRVIDKHKLPKEWTDDPDDHEAQISDWLKENVKYDAITAQCLTADELEIARSVGTNLTALKKPQVDALIKQASCMTELQVRLYCPTLLP